MALMTFPPNVDAMTDVVQVVAKAITQTQEGSRREAWTPGAQLRCSVQPVVGDARQYQGLGAIGVDADYRAVFLADPTASGVQVHAVIRQVMRAGAAVPSPPSFEVVLVQPDGGSSLTWTAYLKFRG